MSRMVIPGRLGQLPVACVVVVGVFVALGGFTVFVGGADVDVAVAGSEVLVGGCAVLVGGTAVKVGVGGTRVAVAVEGTTVAVSVGRAVLVGVDVGTSVGACRQPDARPTTSIANKASARAGRVRTDLPMSGFSTVPLTSAQ
jgi:hypothetical protein